MIPKSRRAMVIPVGRIVHQLRRDVGLTLDALAAKCDAFGGASKRKIQQVERSEPTSRLILEAIASALGVPYSVLVFDISATAETLIRDLYVRQDPTAINRLAHLIDEDLGMWISGDPAVIPFAGEFHGPEGLNEFFSLLFSVITPRENDPPPVIRDFVADFARGTVVVDLENDLVRLRANPKRMLSCKVKLTFQFRDSKLLYFEDLFDTAAWERFLSSNASGIVRG